MWKKKSDYFIEQFLGVFYNLQIPDKDIGTSICIFALGSENLGPGLPVHSLPASCHFCGAPATCAGHFPSLSVSWAASEPCSPQSLPFRERSICA